MNAQHTPGPWVVRQRENYQEHVHEGFFKIDGFTAAGEQEYRVASVIDGNDSPQNEANAHLIAAAPELLEALKIAVSAVETGKAAWPGCADFLESASAVLAKVQP